MFFFLLVEYSLILDTSRTSDLGIELGVELGTELGVELGGTIG